MILLDLVDIYLPLDVPKVRLWSKLEVLAAINFEIAGNEAWVADLDGVDLCWLSDRPL